MARFDLALAERDDAATKEVDTPVPGSALSFRGRFGSPITMPSSAFLAGTLPGIVGARPRVAAPQRSG